MNATIFNGSPMVALGGCGMPFFSLGQSVAAIMHRSQQRTRKMLAAGSLDVDALASSCQLTNAKPTILCKTIN
jgi:hypothetical protein